MKTIYFNLKEYGNVTVRKYAKEKERLQVELLKLQKWVMDEGKRVAIVFEGRDAAGKGSTIKRFVENLMERKTTDDVGHRIVSLGIPTPQESKYWFERYERYLPKEGEMVFFDRSWYNRAMIEPVMGYCSEEQYRDFMKKVNNWEANLVKEGIILLKFYLSVDRKFQKMRFEERQGSPIKYWKFSMNDLAVMGKWNALTKYKEQMFERTSTEVAPWVVIDSNDKLIAHLNAIRYVLGAIDYTGKQKIKRPKWNEELRSLEVEGIRFDNLDTGQYKLLKRMASVAIFSCVTKV